MKKVKAFFYIAGGILSVLLVAFVIINGNPFTASIGITTLGLGLGAVIKRGILGGFSGSVGSVVGSSWKGLAVMKAKPLSVANPNTAAQQAQRTKFSSIVEVAKQLLVEMVKPLWDRFAQGMSGYNMFVSVNVDAFTSSGVFIPSAFVLGQGKLTGTVNLTAAADASTNTVDFGWSNNSGTGTALASDVSFLAYYNSTKDYWMQLETVFTRADLAASLIDNVMAINDELEIYQCFRSADGTRVSNSVWIQAIVVA